MNFPTTIEEVNAASFEQLLEWAQNFPESDEEDKYLPIQKRIGERLLSEADKNGLSVQEKKKRAPNLMLMSALFGMMNAGRPDPLKGVDIVAEMELINQKKSKLSASSRRMVAYRFESLKKDEEKNVAL